MSLGRARRRRNTPFDPRQVPAVAAGFFWDPDAYASSTLPEAQGKTAADLTKTGTITVLSGNGHTQLRCAAGSGHLDSSGGVDLGTAVSYAAGWVRFPTSVGGDSQALIGQYGGAGQRRSLTYVSGATWKVIYSDDGTTRYTWTFDSASAGNWMFVERVIDVGASPATTRARLFRDRVEIAPTSAPSGGSSLYHASLLLRLGDIGGAANVDTTDFGPQYLLPAVPTDAERDLLRGYHAPV